jgi:aryl-alcohol dehydrogenase-like predicted oxidoreductase
VDPEVPVEETVGAMKELVEAIPIPGTKSRKRLEENAAAADLELTPQDLRCIKEAMPRSAVAGARYDERRMRTIDR